MHARPCTCTARPCTRTVHWKASDLVDATVQLGAHGGLRRRIQLGLLVRQRGGAAAGRAQQASEWRARPQACVRRACREVARTRISSCSHARTCRLMRCQRLAVTVLTSWPPGSTADTRTASATSSSATGPSTR